MGLQMPPLLLGTPIQRRQVNNQQRPAHLQPLRQLPYRGTRVLYVVQRGANGHHVKPPEIVVAQRGVSLLLLQFFCEQVAARALHLVRAEPELARRFVVLGRHAGGDVDADAGGEVRFEGAGEEAGAAGVVEHFGGGGAGLVWRGERGEAEPGEVGGREEELGDLAVQGEDPWRPGGGVGGEGAGREVLVVVALAYACGDLVYVFDRLVWGRASETDILEIFAVSFGESLGLGILCVRRGHVRGSAIGSHSVECVLEKMKRPRRMTGALSSGQRLSFQPTMS